MRTACGLWIATILTLGLCSAGVATVEGQRQQGCGQGQATGNPHCNSRQCTLSASPINFGVYNMFDTQALDSVGELSVQCSSAGSVKVSLGAGSFGTLLSRLMKTTAGPDSLSYQVYLDQSRQAIFGDGSSGTSVATMPSSQTAVIRMYARLAPLQFVRAGDYADGLLATFSF